MENKNGFIVVPKWAVTELKLSGNDLIIYCCIYGHSQDGESAFTGSAEYLAQISGCSRRTAFSVIDRLIAAGLISKTKTETKDGTVAEYRAIVPASNNRANKEFDTKTAEDGSAKSALSAEIAQIDSAEMTLSAKIALAPNSASTVDRTPNRYSYTSNDTMEVDNTLESNNNYYSIFSNNKKENQVKEKSDVSVDDEKSKASPPKSRANEEKARVDGIAQQVLDYLNSKTGANFKLRGTVKPYAHEGLIKRIKEGYKLEHFITIIDTKCAEWQGTEQAKYLTPETLFRPCHMENYLDSQKQKETPTAPPPPQDTTVFIQDLVEYPLGSGNYMPRWERDELIAKENGNNGG